MSDSTKHGKQRNNINYYPDFSFVFTLNNFLWVFILLLEKHSYLTTRIVGKLNNECFTIYISKLRLNKDENVCVNE